MTNAPTPTHSCLRLLHLLLNTDSVTYFRSRPEKLPRLINNGRTTGYGTFAKYTYNAHNMVTAIQRFGLAGATSAGPIPGGGKLAIADTPDVNGVFQVTGSTSDSYEVKLYDTNSDLLWEDAVPTTGYLGAWNGLAWGYSLTADLGHNASGQITGPLGSPIASPANILQNFWESGVTSSSGYNSGSVGVQ